MLIVLLNWIFILITSYSIGYAVIYAILSAFGVRSRTNLEEYIKRLPSYNVLILLLGLAFITAYAEFFSLATGVSVVADLVLAVVAIVSLIAYRKPVYRLVAEGIRGRSVLYMILACLFAYGTSRGYMHHDTNLYHAQAIRWIEDYGLVPGLANLQSRFGYNSSEFALNALYSSKWLIGQSMHATAGLFALLSSLVLVDIIHIWEKKDAKGKVVINIRLSDYVRLGMLFYLGIIYSEMISPASDYYAQLMIFNLVIMWLDMNALSKEDAVTFSSEMINEYRGLLCILLVYAITIKLSIGLLVLLALIPGIEWIHSKEYKKIWTCIVAGLAISVPYFVRNYIISGWILYPSTIIKIGSPDWQLPKGEAQYDAREIGMWGRGITRAEDWESVTATNWIRSWFNNLELLEKAWVLASLVAVIAVIVLLVIGFIVLVKRDREINNELLIMSILAVGTIFWFCSAPLVRYGYAYLMIMPLLTLGYMLERMSEANLKNGLIIQRVIFIFIATVIVILKGKGLVTDIIRTCGQDYYIMQQDYIDGEAHSYLVDGETIYVADDAGQIGYYKFPATPDENYSFALRGQGLKEGFRYKE